MASNAARQRAYRERHLIDGTDARLNMIVSAHAKAALKRRARHYAVTERAMLERLLSDTEGELTQEMSAKEQKHYYN